MSERADLRGQKPNSEGTDWMIAPWVRARVEIRSCAENARQKASAAERLSARAVVVGSSKISRSRGKRRTLDSLLNKEIAPKAEPEISAPRESSRLSVLSSCSRRTSSAPRGESRFSVFVLGRGARCWESFDRQNGETRSVQLSAHEPSFGTIHFFVAATETNRGPRFDPLLAFD